MCFCFCFFGSGEDLKKKKNIEYVGNQITQYFHMDFFFLSLVCSNIILVTSYALYAHHHSKR